MVNSNSTIPPAFEQAPRPAAPPGSGLWNVCLQLQQERNRLREQVEMYHLMEQERILANARRQASTPKIITARR